MITSDKRHAKLWCCEDISKIENYSQAVKSDELWVCHHRLELHPDGSTRFTRDSLKKLGLYVQRPASELIFVPYSVHSSMHDKARKIDCSFCFAGELNPMFGKKHSAASRRKMSENHFGIGLNIPKAKSKWAKYGMTRDSIMKNLHLSRKKVEQMDKENMLMEVLHGLV